MPLPLKGDPGELTTSAHLRSAWFVAMLSVIDRTALPRRIVFTNGIGELALDVVQRRMRLISGAPERGGSELSRSQAAAQLAVFCEPARPVSYGLRAIPAPRSDGYSIAELVNAQSQSHASAELPEGLQDSSRRHNFGFDQAGWPLSMPANATAKSLIAAWRANIWMQGWVQRNQNMLGGEILVVAAPAERSYRLSYLSSPGGSELKVFGSENLGQVISEWRSQSE
jgi:hypothetical protein